MTARGSMEAESVPHTQRHSRFCQHAAPQQFLSMLACHCTTWCRYYSRADTISAQYRQSRGYYSRKYGTCKCNKPLHTCANGVYESSTSVTMKVKNVLAFHVTCTWSSKFIPLPTCTYVLQLPNHANYIYIIYIYIYT